MSRSAIEMLKIINARSFIKNSIIEYLNRDNWLEVTSSYITSLTGACETIATVFQLPYFEDRIHLSQTAQLQLEMLVKTLRRKVWTFDHSFRAEPRVTQRHLTEFTMFEMESPNFTLDKIIDIQESLLKHCIKNILEKRESIDFISKERIDFLSNIKFPLRICRYEQAIQILRELGMDVKVGSNLGAVEEKKLLEHFGYNPFFITMYPADIKYFNMKRTLDEKWVFSVDLIAPPYGEVSGGAERENELIKVEKNLKESKMWKDIKEMGYNEEHFEWYLNLWDSGTPGPRGGFGIGFERYVAIFTGIDNITDCIEFPRNKETIFP